LLGAKGLFCNKTFISILLLIYDAIIVPGLPLFVFLRKR